MKINVIIIFLCTLALACGCATKQVSSKQVSGKNTAANNAVKLNPSTQIQVIELLDFCETYSNLTSEAQKKAFATSAQALADNKNDLTHRIKQATMLALPSSHVRDTAKAQNLLQDLLQENNLNAPENALISLLYEYTLFDNKQLQKNRDDIKKLESSQQKIEALQLKFETVQQKNEALEQKLNHIKAIEKTMNERNTKPDNKP